MKVIKKYKVQLTMGIIVLIMTFIITLQFKSVTVNNSQYQSQNARVDELLGDLKKEREQNEDLRKQIEAYQNDIAQYREDAEQNSGYSRFLSDQLKRAELMAGFVDVKGPGITITMSDINNRKSAQAVLTANETLIHDEDLRRVINELCAAGAEAICVNDSRIISTSAVRCVGPTILVNDTKMAPPYVIKAIGKADQLEAAMNLNGGVIDNLRVWGFTISISKHNELRIPKYSGTVNFSSATAVATQKEEKE
ncbi:MAG: DUF881 domain-containing protein [Clostridia bacterium]|nr:DUF881 domain-containing protein [Clostridia bacterium]